MHRKTKMKKKSKLTTPSYTQASTCHASALPATVAAQRGRVAAGPASTSTSTAATATAATTVTTASSAATVADHLGETRIDLLLSLPEHVDEVTSLLGIWN